MHPPLYTTSSFEYLRNQNNMRKFKYSALIIISQQVKIWPL